MTVNSAGYLFTGGSLTVTAGGITANQNATINSAVYIGGAAIMERGSRKNPDGQRRRCTPSLAI